MPAIVTSLHTSYELSPEGQDTRDALTSKIETFNRDKGQYETQADALKTIQTADWTPENDRAAAGLRTRQISLLNREIALREEIERFLIRLQQVEHLTARDVAFNESEVVKADVRRRLVSIGYVDGMVDVGNGQAVAGIPDSIVAHHPAARAAHCRNVSLRGCDTSDARAQNRKEIERCRQNADKLKAAAVAGL